MKHLSGCWCVCPWVSTSFANNSYMGSKSHLFFITSCFIGLPVLTWARTNCSHFTRILLVAQLVKNLPAMQETQVQSLGWGDPWRRKWQPTPVFLPGESQGQRSLVGYSPWDRRESDTTAAKPPPGKYWLNAPSIAGTVLGPKDSTMNNRSFPCSQGA